MITFEESGIRPELIRAIHDLNFELPMPVQNEVIPAIMNDHRDIIALSQTGSGKTAAYGLPLLSVIDETINAPQLLILSPTRELCVQISKDLENYSKYLPGIKIVAVYGGSSIDKQIMALKNGASIIVATPGRINDLIRRKRANLSNVKYVVLDEADEMLNMGFRDDLNTILGFVPENRRTFLFSATMSAEISEIAAGYMKNTREIVIGARNSGAENIRHHYYVVQASDRYQALKRIVDYYPDIYGIVFCRTRTETREVAEKLMKDGYSADALHGDLSQQQRDYAMQRFRLRNLQLLVATDVAARGLDVDDLSHIINYNLPDDNEIYTHRSGRTGRAGKSGISISIIHSRERTRIQYIEKKIRKKFEQKEVPRGKEICEKQLFNLIDRMEKVELNQDQIAEYLPVVFKKLAWLSHEELIARFVSVEFNRFLEYYKNARDLNIIRKEDTESRSSENSRNYKDRGRRNNESHQPGENNKEGNRKHNKKNREENINRNVQLATFRINAGKSDGLNVSELIGMVNSFTRNRRIAIGKIDLKSKESFFEADEAFAGSIINAFRDKSYKSKRLEIYKTGKK